MAGSSAARAAAAWAEKRKAQVEAANAKKAQKEMGEVTSDHTFKPKLRSKATNRSLGSLSNSSGKITEKPSLISPVLKRRAGDMAEPPAPVPETKEHPEPISEAPQAQERAVPKARVSGPLRRGEMQPTEAVVVERAQVSRPAPRSKKESSGRSGGSISPRGVVSNSSMKSMKSVTTSRASRPTSSAGRSRGSLESLETVESPVTPPHNGAFAQVVPSSEGLFCWKQMTHGWTQRWPRVPTDPGAFPPEEPAEPDWLEEPELEGETEHQWLPEDRQRPEAAAEEQEPNDLERLERLREQLEEEQRQLEEEAVKLQSGVVNAEKLQELAEKQQQRLARFDREQMEQQMEQPNETWEDPLEDPSEGRAWLKPLPVITEQPELLEELQSQQLEELQSLQKRWQQEQASLQEKLHAQLTHVERDPELTRDPEVSEATSPEKVEKVEDAEEKMEEDQELPQVESKPASQLAEMLRALMSAQQAQQAQEHAQQQKLLEQMKELKLKCENLAPPEDASRLRDEQVKQERSTRRWPPGPLRTPGSTMGDGEPLSPEKVPSERSDF